MKKNNLVFYFITIIVISITALFLPWGSFVTQGNTLPESLLGKITVTTTGLKGNISFFGISIPHWILIFLTAASACTFVLNYVKMIKIPIKMLWGIDVFVLFWLGIGVYSYYTYGTVGLGLLLMSANTTASLLLKLAETPKK